jgi:hypothetical protein
MNRRRIGNLFRGPLSPNGCAGLRLPGLRQVTAALFFQSHVAGSDALNVAVFGPQQQSTVVVQ